MNALSRLARTAGALALSLLLILSSFVPEAHAASRLPSSLPLAKPGQTLNVLIIGNSFSVDSTQYLYQIADQAGYHLVIGDLYRYQTDIKTHWDFVTKHKKAYTYRTNTNGTWKRQDNADIDTALLDRPWDLIFIQQYSSVDSEPEDYYNAKKQNYASLMGNYARKKCTNRSVKLGWVMTWANTSSSTSSYFRRRYQRNQMKMYNAICKTTQKVVEPTGVYDMIVQSGTAVQNARSSYMGDTLNRDYHHLNVGAGRYLAALCLASACGVDLSNLTTIFTQRERVSDLHLNVLRQCVADAQAHPYRVTSESRRLPVLNMTITQTKTSNGHEVISWPAVPGVKWYQIMRRTPDNPKYTSIYTTSRTTYTDTIRNNQVYYYRVYAMGDRYIKNAASQTVAACYMTPVQLLGAESKDEDSFTCNWARNTKCTGYLLQYADNRSFQNPQKIQIRSNQTLSETVKGLSQGTYYMRVRTYQTVSGRHYYSPWSEVESVPVSTAVQDPETEPAPSQPQKPDGEQDTPAAPIAEKNTQTELPVQAQLPDIVPEALPSGDINPLDDAEQNEQETLSDEEANNATSKEETFAAPSAGELPAVTAVTGDPSAASLPTPAAETPPAA